MLLSFCIMFIYVIYFYLCYLCRTIVLVTTVICWLSPTLSIKFVLSLSLATHPPATGWLITHGDVIKWKPSPRYWPFVRGIRQLPVNSPHKGQWRGALMISLFCTWTNGWVNNRDTGDLRRLRAHYDVTVRSTDDRLHGHRWFWVIVIRPHKDLTTTNRD